MAQVWTHLNMMDGLIFILALGAAVGCGVALARRLRVARIEKNGRVIIGNVMSVNRALTGETSTVSVQYAFHAPDKKAVKGEETIKKWSRTRMAPVIGSPIAVAYHDGHHVIL